MGRAGKNAWPRAAKLWERAGILIGHLSFEGRGAHARVLDGAGGRAQNVLDLGGQCHPTLFSAWEPQSISFGNLQLPFLVFFWKRG